MKLERKITFDEFKKAGEEFVALARSKTLPSRYIQFWEHVLTHVDFENHQCVRLMAKIFICEAPINVFAEGLGRIANVVMAV